MAYQTHNVACVGDSLTNFSGNPAIEWPSYVDLSHAEMLNYAVGGTTIEQADARLTSHAFPQDPVLCIVWTGTNNIEFGDSLATCQAKYAALIATIGSRAAIYFNIAPRAFSVAIDPIRVSMNEWLDSLPITLIDAHTLLVHPTSNRHIATDYTSDGVHLSTAGKRLIASTVTGLLGPIVGFNAHA